MTEYMLEENKVEAAFQKLFLRKHILRELGVTPSDTDVDAVFDIVKENFDTGALKNISSSAEPQIESALNTLRGKIQKALISVFPEKAKPIYFHPLLHKEIEEFDFTEKAIGIGLYRAGGVGDLMGAAWRADAKPMSDFLIEFAEGYFRDANTSPLVLDEKGAIRTSATHLDEKGVQIYTPIDEVDKLLIHFVERFSVAMSALDIPPSIRQELKPLFATVDQRAKELGEDVNSDKTKTVKRMILKALFLRAIQPAMTDAAMKQTQDPLRQAWLKLSASAMLALANGVTTYKAGGGLSASAGARLVELVPQFMKALDIMVQDIQDT